MGKGAQASGKRNSGSLVIEGSMSINGVWGDSAIAAGRFARHGKRSNVLNMRQIVLDTETTGLDPKQATGLSKSVA